MRRYLFAAVLVFAGCADLIGIDDWRSATEGASSSGGGAQSSASATGGGASSGGASASSGGASAGGASASSGGASASSGAGGVGGGDLEATVVTSVKDPGHLAVDDTSVYFTGNDKLWFAPKAASSTIAVQFDDGAAGAQDFVTVDAGYVYWSVFTAQGLIARKAGPPNMVEQLTFENMPLGLMRFNEETWYTSYAGGTVAHIDAMLATTSEGVVGKHPFGLVHDATTVFGTFRGDGPDGGIYRLDPVETLLVAGQSGPTGLAVEPDPAGRVFYLCDDGALRAIAKQPAMLPVVEEVAPPEGPIFAGDVALDATHVYWTGAGATSCAAPPCKCGNVDCTGIVWRVTRAPPWVPEHFATGSWKTLRGVVVDDVAVYWTADDGNVWRQAKP